MKKLKLDLDRIRVVSFNVEAAKTDRGTVNAFSAAPFHCGSGESCESCFPNYCPPMPSSDAGSC